MIKDYTLEAQIQHTLNDLLHEGLIPFALNVGKVTKDADEYTIHFYDSRIHSAVVPILKGHSFTDSVRTCVLTRVVKVSGALTAP